MKKIFITVAAALAMAFNANAQSQITDELLFYKDKSAIVTFDLNTENNAIPSNRKEVITPFIYNGKDTVWLDAVEVYGKNRLKRERQEHRLEGDKNWELEQGQFLKGIVYRYSAETPLKKWMAPANLGIKREVIGCGCEDEQIYTEETISTETLFVAPPEIERKAITDYRLAEVSRKWDLGQDEHELIFKVSKTKIDSTIFNNEVTFEKILSAVDKIYSHQNFKVCQIEIAGYASPEGKQSFNRWLGENRAKALINYIIASRPQLNLTPDNFKIINGEENWEGLRRMTLASQMSEEDKKEIVDIIDSDLGVARKGKLKSLDGGRTYLKMLREVYPHLRSARYLAIYYDSSEDDAVEKINQAKAEIENGEFEKALETIKPYANDFRAYNIYGVALMANKQFEQAIPYLNKAIEEGSQQAKYNLERVMEELERENLLKKEREEYLKQFE